MNWFIFALICIAGWGFADLFYKKGTEETDRYSHLKISVWVGLVMGLCAVCLIPFSETLTEGGFSIRNLLLGALRYSPASIGYIVSMIIGYAGLRYLELSIVSPVQNASGALSAVCMIVYFTVTGRIRDIGDEFGFLDFAGTVFIVIGVIFLAVAERKTVSFDDKETGEKKYRLGALALLFPILYCVFDTIGTAADGIILDEESGFGLGEIDILVLYGLTFFIAGIVCWLFLLYKTGKMYNPFTKTERPKAAAALCEEFGQVFYIFAMAESPVLAAPMVASYCIVSVLLGRFFIKEKIGKFRYICIFAVIIGIILLGISEGLSEM